MANEVSKGHLGRLRLLNRCRTYGEISSRVRDQQQTQPAHPRGELLLFALADLSGVSRDRYVRLHTMLPFSCVSHPHSTYWRTPERDWRIDQIDRVGGLIPRQAAYLCRRCIAADMNRWHFSYWRRFHQLPGVHWCEEHDDELLLAVQSPDAFMRQPGTWLKEGAPTSTPYGAELRGHAVVRRFASICRAMLESGRPWPESKLREPMRLRARELGIRTRLAGDNPFLSDLVTAQVPKTFLGEVFPLFENKVELRFLQSIDGPLRSVLGLGTAESFALAMAVMFDSVDQALAAWAGHGVYLSGECLASHT